MAHAHGDEGGYAAVKAGVKSIEHGTYLTERTLKLMKRMDTFLVPTFTTVVDLTQPGGDYDDPVLIIRGQHMLPSLEKTIKMAYKMGIKIATGADTGYGPNSTTRVGMEITNFVNLGMKPIDAIQSATSVSSGVVGSLPSLGVTVTGSGGVTGGTITSLTSGVHTCGGTMGAGSSCTATSIIETLVD